MKTRKGTTLVELLMYMGLLAILLVAVANIFTAIVEMKVETEATSNVDQDGRFIVSKIMHDLLQADAITSPALGVTSSSLSLINSGNTVSYALSSTNLVRTDSVGFGNLNGSESKITAISFKRMGSATGKNTIKVSLTLESVTVRNAGPESRTYNFTAGIR